MNESEDLLVLEDEGSENFKFDPTNADLFDLGAPDLRDQEGLVYPAILLSNVLFMDCLNVLKTLKRPSYREVDTWVELNGGQEFQHIGSIQLDSQILLALRYLHVGVTAYYSHEELEVLDLNNPTVIEQFI